MGKFKRIQEFVGRVLLGKRKTLRQCTVLSESTLWYIPQSPSSDKGMMSCDPSGERHRAVRRLFPTPVSRKDSGYNQRWVAVFTACHETLPI